eukprot:97883-Chlamydomonas_euryale.AAC.1
MQSGTAVDARIQRLVCVDCCVQLSGTAESFQLRRDDLDRAAIWQGLMAPDAAVVFDAADIQHGSIKRMWSVRWQVEYQVASGVSGGKWSI